MRITKRRNLILISILIAAVLVLTGALVFAMGTPAMANAADEQVPNATEPHDHVADNMTTIGQAQYDALTSGTLTAGTYYLSENISGNIIINDMVTLCLNGKTVTGNGTNSVITVSENANFTLCDCQKECGKITGGNAQFGGGVCVMENGTFTMYGGEISNNSAYLGSGFGGDGGGVCVMENGTFTMYGGEISGNTAEDQGGGVYVEGGTFTMNSGAISGNIAEYGGGGVCVGIDGTFTMNGGTISGNTAANNSGGVCVNSGTFTMNGGTVSGNDALLGGGVCVVDGKFTMEDGEIKDNIGTYGAGGVLLIEGTFEMKGGVISGNAQTEDMGLGYCGGVCVSHDAFAAEETEATFKISGAPVITGNKVTIDGEETENNVCLFNDKIITVAGELTEGAKIGVYRGGSVATGFMQDGDPAEYFICDDADENCIYVGDKESGAVVITTHFTTGNGTVDKEPTCTEPGIESKHCTKCGKGLNPHEIPANGHVFSHYEAQGATCEEDGVLAYSHCVVCDKNYIDGVEKSEDDLKIEALGHDYGEWTVVKEATETEEGEEQRVCSHDPSHVDTRAIPKIIDDEQNPSGQKHDIALIIVVAILAAIVLAEAVYFVCHAIRSKKARKEEKK